MTIVTNNTIQLKAYSTGELAKLYGVSWRTLKKWIAPFEAEIGERRGRFYTITQVRIIFDKLSLPATIGID